MEYSYRQGLDAAGNILAAILSRKTLIFSKATLIEEADLSGIELASLLNDLRTKANTKSGINFDNSRDDEEYHDLTGVSCAQFDELLTCQCQ